MYINRNCLGCLGSKFSVKYRAKLKGKEKELGLHLNVFNNDCFLCSKLPPNPGGIKDLINIIFSTSLNGAIKQTARKWDFTHQLDIY